MASSSVETILEQYQVDRAHARYVADLALTIFDGSEPLHDLSKRDRELLEMGALLHNVGLHINEGKHHTVGRDILLNTPIEGLNDDERAMVVCMVVFHRKKVRPEAEAAFLRLRNKKQKAALKLAAIVRVADGLDSSQSQSTVIDSVELQGKELSMTTSGPHATDDSARAIEKANLWKKVFDAPLMVNTISDQTQAEVVSSDAVASSPEPVSPAAELTTSQDSTAPETTLVGPDGFPFPSADAPASDTELVAADGTVLTTEDVPLQSPELVTPEGTPLLSEDTAATTIDAVAPDDNSEKGLQLEFEPWKLQPSDTLCAAARKVLRRYFQKLLTEEAEVHKSEDPEGIHQMRVATRRLRATLQALGSEIDPKQAQHFRRQLRAVASELGTVRDRDVFLEHVASSTPNEGAASSYELAPLINALTEERDAAKKRLLDKLKDKRYTRFKHEFAHFVTASDEDTGEGDAPVARVRYAAGSAIWRRYEELRAYETLVPINEQIDPDRDMTRLHQMRIVGKHFRYTLELFAEALGPHVDDVLDPLISLQEHLGSLQDIEVASAFVAALPTDKETDAGPELYLQTRYDDRDRLLRELPERWATVAGEEYRRRLTQILVKL